MPDFYIVPPRLIPGSLPSSYQVVTSLNGLKGDLFVSANTLSGLSLSITNKTLNLSITPDFYVKKAGDQFLGNLDFFPTAGKYGLKVLASTADPTENAEGALYFNTNLNQLKVYSDGAWLPLAQSGALDITTGDGRYLKLDASNDPITGDLDLGTTVLRVGNKSADPLTGFSGQIYYNTAANILKYYNGSAWAVIGAGGGSTTLNPGNGITLTPNPITTAGTIAVDEAYNFNWTGAHTHTQAISFSASQTFNITGLTIASQATGDLIYRSAGGWTRRAIGNEGEVLKVVSGLPTWGTVTGSGTNTLGTPTIDGTYNDGFFSTWTSSTLISDAFDDINELLNAIAPAQANPLTGTSLSTSGVTFYSAIVSSGIPDWYYGGASAGSTITTYFVSGSNIVGATANTATTYKSGKANDTATYGTTAHKKYTPLAPSGNSIDPITMSAIVSTPSTTGTLTITSFITYNSIWKKANASISYTHNTDGWEGHSIVHTDAGETNVFNSYYDSYSAVNPTPAFSTAPTATEGTVNFKYLSGIAYYTATSTFQVRFIAASGIFNRCYHPTKVAAITGTGMNETPVNPVSTPVYTDTFDKSGGNFAIATINVSGRSSLNKYLTVALNKPAGGSTSGNAALNYHINTFGTTSTTTAEYFQDEAQRLVLSTTTAWTSTTTLANGNAQVRNHSTANTGCLQFANSTEYPGFSGDQEYQRFFYKTSASTGTLTFTNIAHTDIAPYGTGNLNVLIYLDADNKWFDLGVAQGSNANDGSSRSAAISAKTSGSGGAVGWSLGNLYTTGPTTSGNLGRFRLVIIIKNTSPVITSIVSS